METEEKKNDEKSKSFAKDVLDFVVYCLTVVIISLLIVKFVAVRTVVDGSSMEPLLHNGNNLILQKITYYVHDPERFDVIVFELKDEPGTHYVKRVIGLPGETVQITDGKIYIDGEELTDDIYGMEEIEEGGIAEDPITLGEGQYFCMGDNRNHSRDSRSSGVGPIDESQILGKILLRFWPLNEISIITGK